MKPQHTQSSPGQGDWDRSRNETDPRTGAASPEYGGRPYPRSAPAQYPESHQQYQAQRDHPGSEYFGGSTGYGGRGDYPQQQQGQGGYGSQQQGQQGQQGYGGGSWSHSETERSQQQGGYRQQEGYQSAGGRQQGFGGSEDFGHGGYGGYGREEQGHQFGGQYGSGQQRESQGSQYGRGSFEERPFESGGHQQQSHGWGETGRWASGQSQGGQSQGYQPQGYGGQQGGQGYGQGYGQQERYGQGYGGQQGQQQGQRQDYGGYQSGQPQSYGNAQQGQFNVQPGYPSGGQPSGGYGSYGAYQTGSQQAGLQGRTPRAPKDYVRSDERIRELICESLAHHPNIDASDVSVQVSQGRVTLEGAVPERRMKHEIEDLADSCWGVKDVENHIRIQTAGQQPNLGSATQSWMAAPADVATGGASTRAVTGRTREQDMSPTETGTGSAMTGATGSTTTTASVRGKTTGTEAKTKGKA